MTPGRMEQPFLDECSEGVTTMETVLVQLPVGASPSDALDALFRIAHSIKGGAATLGLSELASLSHSLETLLDAMRSQRVSVSREVLDVLLRSVDLLRAMLAARSSDSRVDTQVVVDLQLELEALAAGGSAGAVPASADALDNTSIRLVGDLDSGSLGWGTIRVGVELVDSLMAQVAALAQRHRALEAVLPSLAQDGPARIGEHVAGLLQASRELERSVAELRTVPISLLFRRFPRMVRDLAIRLGKQVDLRIEGGDTEIDKATVERVGDALVQLVRNALDHGIETPAERRRAGKPESGTLWLHAATRGDAVVIEVGEDGAGLAREAIRRKATAARGPETESALTDAQIDALIFLPGLTTVDAPTEISGRGVGMDVVRRNLQSIQASIDVESERGRGCRFRIVVPRRPGAIGPVQGLAIAAAE